MANDAVLDGVKVAIVRLRMRMGSVGQDELIQMGCALYLECRRHGLVKDDEFTPHGPGFRSQQLPAYGRNIVLVDPELPEWEYRVGDEDT